jgi:hypothetical protein
MLIAPAAPISLMLRFSVALILSTTVAMADDCPDAKSGKSGFVVERGESSSTDVFHIENSVIRTVMRSGGNALLETTQYEGLIQLDRIDRGRRTTFRPKGDLAAIFPLKVGQQASAEFEYLGADGRSTVATVGLTVKEKGRLFIGPCGYDVFKVERSESRGEQPPRVINVDYYAPALKLVIAKEYKEKDGRSTLVKFDRIYPIKR